MPTIDDDFARLPPSLECLNRLGDNFSLAKSGRTFKAGQIKQEGFMNITELPSKIRFRRLL